MSVELCDFFVCLFILRQIMLTIKQELHFFAGKSFFKTSICDFLDLIRTDAHSLKLERGR